MVASVSFPKKLAKNFKDSLNELVKDEIHRNSHIASKFAL